MPLFFRSPTSGGAVDISPGAVCPCHHKPNRVIVSLDDTNRRLLCRHESDIYATGRDSWHWYDEVNYTLRHHPRETRRVTARDARFRLMGDGFGEYGL